MLSYLPPKVESFVLRESELKCTRLPGNSIAVAGGGFTFNYKDETSKTNVNVGLKSDGIIEKLRRYFSTKKSAQAKMKVLEKHAKGLQIKDPEDLVKVFKELDDNK